LNVHTTFDSQRLPQGIKILFLNDTKQHVSQERSTVNTP